MKWFHKTFLFVIKNNIHKILSIHKDKCPQSPSLKQGLQSRAGQVSVIFILIAAMVLILYAVTLNISHLGEAKTLTIMASNTSASLMASMMASYGEQMMQENLGGRRQYCKSTGIIGLIIAIIITIILIILHQYYGVAIFASLTAAYVSLAFQVINLILQLAVVQPAITEMWNDMMSHAHLSNVDMFIERGVQTALQNSVTDDVKIPDLMDFDQDGFYGYLKRAEDATSADDYVSRFVLYNTYRLYNLPAPNTGPIEAFKNALNELVFQGADDFGLHDPVECGGKYALYPFSADPATPIPGDSHPCCPADPSDPRFLAECDPCCLPQWETDETGTPITVENPPGSGTYVTVPLADECCYNGTACSFIAGPPATCGARSLYPAYPYVYDAVYEDSFNNDPTHPHYFISFRERIGKDDENHAYRANSALANWHSNINARQISEPDPSRQEFFPDDTSGFWPTDDQVGMYPLFYALGPFGMNLPALTYLNDECHWCDPDDPTPVAPPCAIPSGRIFIPLDLDTAVTQPGIAPVNPDTDGLIYNTSWCVDNANQPGNPPLVADRIPGIPRIFLADNVCAGGDPTLDNDPGEPGWKRGTDRFCSAIWPYDNGCAKHGSTCTWDPEAEGICDSSFDPTCTTSWDDCECGEGDAAPPEGNALVPFGWRDDELEMIYYQLGVFVKEAKTILATPTMALARNFLDWYDDAADWIEPPCPDPSNCPGSYTKKPRAGRLWDIRGRLRYYDDALWEWIDGTVFKTASGGTDAYVGNMCSGTAVGNLAVWCVPPEMANPNSYGINECPGVNLTEANTFDWNGNGARGDIADVIACLDWNVNDSVTFDEGTPADPSDDITVTGNAEKFYLCSQPATCSLLHCSNLPRSLVPGFANFLPFGGVDPTATAAIAACLRFDGAEENPFMECVIDCPILSANYPGDPYFFPPWQAPAFTQNANSCGDPAFEADVTAALATATPGSVEETLLQTCLDAITAGDLASCGQNCDPCPYSPPQPTDECVPYYDPYNISGPWDPPELNIITDPGSCEYFLDMTVDPTTLSDGGFASALLAAESQAAGSCADTDPGGFIDQVTQSWLEAESQVIKFRKRLDYLQTAYQWALDLSNRNAGNPSEPDGAMFEAVNQLTAFLDGGTDYATAVDSPSEELISGRTNDPQDISGGTSSVAVYAWQDPPDYAHPRIDPVTGAEKPEGYWHAILAEVRLPKRCNDSCGVGGGSDPDWPTVKTKTSKWGTQRCYWIANTEGWVKARVIRWDEDKDSTFMNFPEGTKIWDIHYGHPDRNREPVSDLALFCRYDEIQPAMIGSANPYGIPYGPAFPSWTGHFGAAHMLNHPRYECAPTCTPSQTRYNDCWDETLKYLSKGVKSETCAEYYLDYGDPGFGASDGFRMRFVPCDRNYILGNN